MCVCFAVLCCVWSVCRERILRGFFWVCVVFVGCVCRGKRLGEGGRKGWRWGGGGGPGVGGQGGKGKVRSEGRGTIGSSKERLSVGDEGGSEEEGSGKVVGWGGWVMMGKGREGAGGHGGR